MSLSIECLSACYTRLRSHIALLLARCGVIGLCRHHHGWPSEILSAAVNANGTAFEFATGTAFGSATGTAFGSATGSV